MNVKLCIEDVDMGDTLELELLGQTVFYGYGSHGMPGLEGGGLWVEDRADIVGAGVRDALEVFERKARALMEETGALLSEYASAHGERHRAM